MKKPYGRIIQNKRGQTTVTIPKALASALDIKKGMLYTWKIGERGELILKLERLK